ncbi:hypothetical protein [Acinetobacter rathckeae]|uniref:hypothetical protein n=1 Tax=Acinetobacter rathckeae TaxID=2605272 RepID=UPI0018A2C5DF|nr:hypothetical protein [Acinetobacter rathckeae]MBF7688508.1 hypothetical protein [Acinetobacter rathckeae]MBF7695592.1 hypothetical protein [Acinetobacter rathckeae]
MSDLYFSVIQSRLKYRVQAIWFILIVIFIYQSVALKYTVLSACFLMLILYMFLREERKLSSFALLDQNIWTFEYTDSVVTKEVCLILDHQLYFAFCFSGVKRWSTQIIWRDQLTPQDYKKMKVLARLYSQSLNSKDHN